jgi:major vault protein
LRSVLRNSLKQYAVSDFYANGISIVRDLILGERGEDGKRKGWLFEENGMHIYEVEVLGLKILDKDIEGLLFKTKHNEIRKNIELSNRKKDLVFTKEVESLNQEMAVTKSETHQVGLELEKVAVNKEMEVELTRINSAYQTQKEQLDAKLKEQQQQLEINRLKLAQEKDNQALQLETAQMLLEQRLQELKSDVDAVVQKAGAISPDLIAALQAFGDKALAEKMAETMAPLSIIGGKSVVEVFANLVKGTKLEKVLNIAAERDSDDEVVLE